MKKLLEPHGKIFSITGAMTEIPLVKLANLFSSNKTILFFVKSDGKLLEGLSQLIRQGKVKLVIEKVYTLESLAQALRHVENGKIAGKIGISIS